MAVRFKYNEKHIKNKMQQILTSLDQSILRSLNYLGVQCVNIARGLDTYKDRTANLRNSIGYMVLKSGIVVESVFNSNGETGKEQGEEYAKSLVSKFAHCDYALVVVAGMNYASYVENVHGLDVLQPAKYYAENRLDDVKYHIMEALNRKAK